MPREPPGASLPPGGIPWIATIPTPNWVWTLLLRSFGNVGLTLGIGLLKCPYMYLGVLLTFLWIVSPSKAGNLMNFLVHVKGQQEDKGHTPWCFSEFSTCSTSPSWTYHSSGACIIVSACWIELLCPHVPVPILLWLVLIGRSPGQEEGFEPANPKALLCLTVTPFCFKK